MSLTRTTRRMTTTLRPSNHEVTRAFKPPFGTRRRSWERTPGMTWTRTLTEYRFRLAKILRIHLPLSPPTKPSVAIPQSRNPQEQLFRPSNLFLHRMCCQLWSKSNTHPRQRRNHHNLKTPSNNHTQTKIPYSLKTYLLFKKTRKWKELSFSRPLPWKRFSRSPRPLLKLHQPLTQSSMLPGLRPPSMRFHLLLLSLRLSPRLSLLPQRRPVLQRQEHYSKRRQPLGHQS